MGLHESFVYCWTDHKTGKLYVGSHKGLVDDGYICSQPLFLDIYNERPTDFTREIIAEGEYKDIRNLESVILKSCNAALDECFYNLNNGDGKFYSKKGRIFTDIHKQNMSLCKQGKPSNHTSKKHTEESKTKIKLGNLGKKYDSETRDKMRQSHLGKRHSKETKIKMRESYNKRIHA